VSHAAVVCHPLRSPVGRYGGVLRTVEPADLAAQVVSAVVKRSGLPSDAIDEVALGQCYPNSEAPAIGRVAALNANLPAAVTGLQLDRRCGSGLQAVLYAAMMVQTGVSDVVLAGGTESMSQAEYYTMAMRWGARAENQVFYDRLARGRVTAGGVNYPVPGGMIETAENLRRDYGISREEQDLLALASHQRAVAAQESGRFAEEIVPIELPAGGTVDRDEHPRADASLQALSGLRPIRRKVDPHATVTAGNASGQNDGAAVCIVASEEAAERYGLRPLARVLGWSAVGVMPDRMGIGPVPATERVLTRLGLRLADMDLIELNEAFAAQVLACTREWRIDALTDDRLNPNGSGISLGHPVGATGCRILTTLVRELDRRNARYGLETMCVGGGQGLAAVFERIA
jgi:acetyl-CoA C-acetyltransferase